MVIFNSMKHWNCKFQCACFMIYMVGLLDFWSGLDKKKARTKRTHISRSITSQLKHLDFKPGPSTTSCRRLLQHCSASGRSIGNDKISRFTAALRFLQTRQQAARAQDRQQAVPGRTCGGEQQPPGPCRDPLRGPCGRGRSRNCSRRRRPY